MISIETTDCPLCFSADCVDLYEFSPYRVVQCNVCQFFYLSPRPTEAASRQLYSGTYFEGGGYDDYASQEKALRATFANLLKNLKLRGICSGKLLEIGCGHGYLLDEARPYFTLRHGTEFSLPAVAIASKKADCVFHGGIEEIKTAIKYDCIIATHVIEHVYKPYEFINKLTTHLSSKGYIVIATPDIGSFWKKILGKRWPSFKIPEHVMYYDEKSLIKFMNKAGLKDITTIPFPHYFPYSLVAAKLGLKLPQWTSQFKICLPATTIAVFATLPVPEKL